MGYLWHVLAYPIGNGDDLASTAGVLGCTSLELVKVHLRFRHHDFH
jgi:hypothetical protein